MEKRNVILTGDPVLRHGASFATLEAPPIDRRAQRLNLVRRIAITLGVLLGVAIAVILISMIMVSPWSIILSFGIGYCAGYILLDTWVFRD